MNKLRLQENMPHEQWLRLRKRGIGGSDAGVIMGVNPYRSILELYHDKTSEELIENEETEATYWGHIMEPIVREEFAKRSGLEVQLVPYLLQHEEYIFMQANLDGIVHDPVYGKCIFEAKTSSAYKKEEWENGIPETYYAQLQHYMAVTDWNGAYIAALIGGNEFIYRFIPRDDAYIAQLISKEASFWNYVKMRIEPPADGSKATTEYLKAGYAKAEKDSVIILDLKNQKWLDQYNEASKAEKIAADRKEEAKNIIQQQMGDNETAYIGNNMIRWANETSHRVDIERLKQMEPEIYKAYLADSHCRKFKVKCG